MSEEFEELRATLPLEPISFDSVKHCQYVLATDIFDKELNDSQEPLGQGFGDDEVDHDLRADC
jgi:hypothetical protein